MAGGLAGVAAALSQAESRHAAFDVLASFARALGFADLVLTIETGAATVKRDETRWSTLNRERVAALDAMGFDGHDPIRRVARRSLDPFAWTAGEWPGRTSASGRDIVIGLHEIAIEAGMTAAVWGRAGRLAVVDAFGGPERIRMLSPWDREAFLLAAGMTFRAIERLSLVPGGASLTRREIEILDLASQGLAARAIARRLDIVEPTVKFHLKSARVKLDARNTSEAIARYAALDLSSDLPGWRDRESRRPSSGHAVEVPLSI